MPPIDNESARSFMESIAESVGIPRRRKIVPQYEPFTLPPEMEAFSMEEESDDLDEIRELLGSDIQPMEPHSVSGIQSGQVWQAMPTTGFSMPKAMRSAPSVVVPTEVDFDRLRNIYGEISYGTLIPDEFRSLAGEDRHEESDRSEENMVHNAVDSEGFPMPNFKHWNSNSELSDAIDDWHVNAEYRERWIFARREREGFNRRNIGQFTLADVLAKLDKRKQPHSLDTETSRFYDWKLGGSQWVMRLELSKHEGVQFLASRFIHMPTNKEVRFDLRAWNDDRQKFVHIYTAFSESAGNERRLEQQKSSMRIKLMERFGRGDEDDY